MRGHFMEDRPLDRVLSDSHVNSIQIGIGAQNSDPDLHSADGTRSARRS
jgi:hypothetical protein